MAGSGSVDFSSTGGDIITAALQHCGVLEAGEVANEDDTATGLRGINIMAKAWMSKGYKLWLKKEAFLFQVPGQTKYTLGPGSADHATENYSETTLAVAGAASDPSITVVAATSITVGRFIGVQLDSGAWHWTTVSAISGVVVTLTLALAGAAALDAKVYHYASKIPRPLRVMSVRRRDGGTQDIPIATFSRQEYFDTPNKTSQGKVVQIYYDPQLDNGELHVWPAPDSIKDIINFTWAKPVDDFDLTTDLPDFPQEWLDALEFGLAVRFCPAYGVPMDERLWLKGQFDEKYADLESWDSEPESILFQPDMTGYD